MPASPSPSCTRHLDRSKARIWAGLRPVSPAGTPIMGPAALKGLWVNAGHGHLGWTLACGSGRVVADMVSGKKPEIAVAGAAGRRRCRARLSTRRTCAAMFV